MSDLIEDLLQMHLQVLEHLVRGKSFEHIQEDHRDDFDQLNYVTKMKNCGLLSFDDNGILIGAYPISPAESMYQLDIEGLGSAYAMCAIDALGAAYTFNRKTEINTIDYARKEPLRITIDPQLEKQTQHNLVVSYKQRFNEQSAAVAQCPKINFYASSEDVPKDSDLEILSFQEALEHGKEIFSQEGLKFCIKAGAQSPLSDCCGSDSELT